MKRLRQGFADVNHNDHDYHRYSDYEYRHDQRSEQYDEQYEQSNHRPAQQYADDPYYHASHNDDAAGYQSHHGQSHHDDYHTDSFSPRRDEPIEPTFDAPYVEDADYYTDQFDAEYDHADDYAPDYYESAQDEQEYHPHSYDSGYAHEYDDRQREPIIHAHPYNAPDALRAEDFYDTSHQSNNRLAKSLGKIGVGITAVAFILAFSAITIIASKPQLTPAEIVQMDGYQGSDTGKSQTMYFNLASLRDCDNTEDCEGIISANDTAANSADRTANSTAQSAPRNVDYREIPAVAITSNPQTAPTAAIESSTRLVRQQWSIVRDQPDMSGAIITSLAANKRVEVIDQIGDWYQIRHESAGGSRTGYMHQSLLQAAQ